MLLRVLFAFCCAWATPSFAGHLPLSGADLLNRCTANEDACEAYILGVIDNWCATESWLNCSGHTAKHGENTVCLPDNVGSKHLKDAVVRWLQKYDVAQIADAANLVLLALSDAYPCPKTD